MSLKKIKALTFDNGGTILDWHNGLNSALLEKYRKIIQIVIEIQLKYKLNI